MSRSWRGWERGDDDLFEGSVPGVRPGDRYRYRVDDKGDFPDPASRSQPEGVHGPSEVVDPGRFAWTDGDWPGVEAEDLVFYELHVGTFSPEGTFDGVTRRLGALRDLGVLDLPDGIRWRVVLTTKDPEFAESPSPPIVNLDGPTKTIRFAGPAAVIPKAGRWERPNGRGIARAPAGGTGGPPTSTKRADEASRRR